jgi:chromosome segregation ATPase
MEAEERGGEEFLNEEIKELQDEVASWKAKYKTLQMQKRGSDIGLNKIKTEINSLRNVDHEWKNSAKQVYLNLNDAKAAFDAQIDQIVGGLSGLTKAGQRVTSKIPYNSKVKEVIEGLQLRVAKQEDNIVKLNSHIRLLVTELTEKTEKVNRLSAGIDVEVARLMAPLRDKLAESMTVIMKEKAGRAQERRDLAALWPTGSGATPVLMPTLLLRYRAHSDEERLRRLSLAQTQDANRALACEIRSNVTESKMWEMKYDDYGRPYYEHTQTSQVDWEKPLILSYKPPPGRDEMGNILSTEEISLMHWSMQTDHKGEVCVIYRRR